VGLASDAASVALNAQKGAVVALGLLEHGRGVLAASLEEVRVDTLDLQEAYPALATRFVQLRDILGKPSTRNEFLTTTNPTTSGQAQARQRYNADRELDKLIIEIRKQPGFDDFLLAPSEDEMRLAAQKGPIVTINVSRYRCDAILIAQDKISSLHLPNLTSEEIEEKAKTTDDLGSPIILEWLWDAIMHPVLESLGLDRSPSGNNWPHIWWIPTGALSKFPLHAAGYHGRGTQETVLDRVMSSYSSSVKAIIHGRRRPAKQPTSAHALLIAMEHTPGNSRLPFAAKEIAILHDPFRSMGLDPIQPGQYKRDLVPYLPQCRIFHFAGHGYTDKANPSKSCLLLRDGKDGPLTVANLLEMNLREYSPFLAYLSACGTGQIRDERFLDESIHLISAFQLAGFRHVIGTLWKVDDETCMDMARITYKTMAGGNMKDESVCQGLHQAARRLRDHCLNRPSVSQTEVDNLGGRHVGSDRLPRDIIWYDSDMDSNDVYQGTRYLPWVPYVHFGV
jgi:hypothetical protein